jgi:hypothetical protein
MLQILRPRHKKGTAQLLELGGSTALTDQLHLLAKRRNESHSKRAGFDSAQTPGRKSLASIEMLHQVLPKSL